MGWLQDYLEFTQAQESPEEFHLWCGISVLAATLNRRVWLPRVSADGVERFRSYPGQVSIILVAGSGKAKKSTAIQIAQETMKFADVRIFDGKITPERLLNKMATYPDKKATMTIIASELGMFLSKASYNDGMILLLTKLYDCRDDAYETQTGQVQLRDVCATILGATTPKGVGRSIPAQAHEEGFLGRWFWVYADRSTKVEPLATTRPDPLTIKRGMELRTKLVGGLKLLNTRNGPIDWTPDANAWYLDWYDKYSKSSESGVEGWYQRRPNHMLCTALCLEASANGLADMTLSLGSCIAADQLLAAHIEANFSKSFAFIGRNSSNELYEHILNVFRRAVGTHVTSTELTAATLRYSSSVDELKIALKSLREAQIIEFVGIIGSEERWKMLREPT